MDIKKQLRAALISALGFGFGFAIGAVLIELISEIGAVDWVEDLFATQRLYIGLVVIFVTVFGGGAVAGAIGGFALSFARPDADRGNYVKRTAFGVGAGFALVLYPFALLLSMFALYNQGDGTNGFILFVTLMAIVFGFVVGVVSGAAPTQRVNYKRIVGASSLSFGIGGIFLGWGLWRYFTVLNNTSSEVPWLLMLIFLFGAVGGFVLGWIFSLVPDAAAGLPEEVEGNFLYRFVTWVRQTKFYQKRGFWGSVLFFVGLFVLSRLIAMSPLNFSRAALHEYLPSRTIATHWTNPLYLSASEVATPSIAVQDSRVFLAWAQPNDAGGQDIFMGSFEGPYADPDTVFTYQLNVSNRAETQSTEPQVAVDSQGRVHLIWTEAPLNEIGNSEIFYSRCDGLDCTTPVHLSDLSALECASSKDESLHPVLAINSKQQLMALWQTGTGELVYSQWSAESTPPAQPSGCALQSASQGAWPRLTTAVDGRFLLAFEAVQSGRANEIFAGTYDASKGLFDVVLVGEGNWPEIYADDEDDQYHVTWCGADQRLNYWTQGKLQQLDLPACTNRPTLAKNSAGVLRLLWYASEVQQLSGQVAVNHVIYESIIQDEIGSFPTIIAQTGGQAQPDLSIDGNGDLHLTWLTIQDGRATLSYAAYQKYTCDQNDLSDLGHVMLDIATSGVFRPPADTVPFCHNHVDQLIHMPNPRPEFSDQPATENGGFDDVANLVRSAKYEVLFSTMWYDKDETGFSPGVILARGVKDLYDQVKADPAAYPRGVTVRILLDNPPELTASNLISQIWNVFNDLRTAGVPTMSDPEIGWKLEVANFGGSWPHGHTKIVVVDGRTVIAAGFNYQHAHMPEDQPSGKGEGRVDMGIQVTGPVAQFSQLAFDDLWGASHKIECSDLGSDSPLWWLSCRRAETNTSHVPEVLRYYVPLGDANAFSLHRTSAFDESDLDIVYGMRAAQETIDTIQVNFSLPIYCDLNVLIEVCDFENALDYMKALVDVVDERQVRLRILIEGTGFEGLENGIAVKALREELAKRGLSHLVEIRHFDGRVHTKAVLIDQEYLVVGSQNFHYSAFGEGSGLTEFNIATDDAAAVAEFQRLFTYYWDRATPAPSK